MRLQERLQSSQAEWPIEFNRISPDVEFARDIQERLGLAGLLDPPADGSFGTVSGWALNEFAAARKLEAPGNLTKEIAQALLATDIAETFPLVLDGNFASKVVRALQRRRYWICRHPACLNIVYVEGAGPDGVLNDNAPNSFNDARLLIVVGKDGKPSLTGWEATTEPGRHFTENPENPGGAARIAFGQYKSWTAGTHRLGKPNAHEALVQAADVTVCRDLNKDFKRDHDKRDTGIFGINQHWGFDLPKGDIGKASAGCLVGRSKDEHREFMRRVRSDARFQANNGYRFMTAIIPGAALDETAFDPATPH